MPYWILMFQFTLIPTIPKPKQLFIARTTLFYVIRLLYNLNEQLKTGCFQISNGVESASLQMAFKNQPKMSPMLFLAAILHFSFEIQIFAAILNLPFETQNFQFGFQMANTKWLPNTTYRHLTYSILVQTIRKLDKLSGFQMVPSIENRSLKSPVLEGSVFGSPLYCQDFRA